MGECWGEGTATFMILGNVCTRSCGFCAVATGRPEPVDWDEPQRVAEAIFLMKVKHAVITSVDRDELKDGGSTIWYNTIAEVAHGLHHFFFRFSEAEHDAAFRTSATFFQYP